MESVAPNYTEFSDPRLAALYDTLNPLGDDSEFFCKLADKLSAKKIVDLGCGTGLLTCELAKRGREMTGIEPAEAMLAVARSKPYADQVTWIKGSFREMSGIKADMILMTSHVAQFFLDEKGWRAMLESAHKALKSGGYLVFDIRRLSSPPFKGWPTETNRRKLENSAFGPVEWWFKLLEVKDKRVRYELHYFFVQSGEEVVSLNELVFRTQEEITRALTDVGFKIETVYGDWDSSLVTAMSGEMIFVARRD
ncbi:MAG: class I SAM-dependent methyltransferase [Candidatus Taylorbacteria bacterium]|nr:class I SAM-dependent methyltransferase [Candidatus Taylorbacteria bacterium]